MRPYASPPVLGLHRHIAICSFLPSPLLLSPVSCYLHTDCFLLRSSQLEQLERRYVLTICVSPAACLLCWPIGESVGNAFVVKRLVKGPLASLLAIMPPLSLFGFLGGDNGFEEKLAKAASSRGD